MKEASLKRSTLNLQAKQPKESQQLNFLKWGFSEVQFGLCFCFAGRNSTQNWMSKKEISIVAGIGLEFDQLAENGE